MKTLLLLSLIAFLSFGCNPNNPTTHTVRYETTGTLPYDILYVNETGSYNTLSQQTAPWSVEFERVLEVNKSILQLQAESSDGSLTGWFTVKIYVDGSLWKNAEGDVAAAASGTY